MNFIKILVVVYFVQLNVIEGQLNKGDLCELNNRPAVCKSLVECPEAIAIVKNGGHPKTCGYEGVNPVVCCEQADSTNLTSTRLTKIIPRKPGIVSNEKCQEYTKYIPKIEASSEGSLKGICQQLIFQNIVGGQPADVGEFPHVVQLGYDYRGIFWACTGSLISDQYVLTAAHCLTYYTLGDAKYVRMGIVDLVDKDHLQQYDISDVIPYPEYDGRRSLYHDIGLAKLSKKVIFNDWVRPACLYTKSSPPSPLSPTTAVGWGATTFKGQQSKILFKVILELYETPRCNKSYVGAKKLTQGIKDEWMVCAGSPNKIGDTCEGDSGGPLEIYREAGDNDLLSCMYDVIGVTAFGKPCGITENVPSVYTRVSFYIKWIEDIVWPAILRENENSLRGNSCQLKNGTSGICKFIADCPTAETDQEKCKTEGTEVVVCCKETHKYNPPEKRERWPGQMSDQKCLEYTKYIWTPESNSSLLSGKEQVDKTQCPFNTRFCILGTSVPAERKQFPHMVQLGYETENIKWLCEGALISDQYVLTAAHCLSDRTNGDVTYVRMGLVDVGDKEHVQQIKVADLIPHPDYYRPFYNTYYHNIGLVKLSKKVELNSWVRPACLYTKRSLYIPKIISAGWNRRNYTQNADTFMSGALIKLYDQTECNKTYKSTAGTRRLREGIKDETMICAGSTHICMNGPIQLYRWQEEFTCMSDKPEHQHQFKCMYDIVGVASFGILCGLPDIPDVYTRVSYYIKWIEDIVWPVTNTQTN